MLFILFILVSCNTNINPVVKKSDEYIKSDNVTTASIIFDSVKYQVVIINNHQYLTNNKGGICHLESCRCTTENQLFGCVEDYLKIDLIQTVHFDDIKYHIIQVNEHKYISNGATIIHMQNCPCDRLMWYSTHNEKRETHQYN